MPRTVRVTTPSRLHFGLLRFDQADDPGAGGIGFGGLGVMIERPRVVVELTLSQSWSAAGPAADRALAHAKQAVLSSESSEELALQVRVVDMPSQHSGLGAGTQLALATAAGARTACGLPRASLADLVASVQRGQRSAVGSYGFDQGGLIFESGKTTHDVLGKLEQRVDMPTDWQIVLITSPTERGRHGQQESDAFRQLGSMPPKTTEELSTLAVENILPAAQQRDAESFDEAVYRYGRLAGGCFARLQGGPFASEAIARRIAILRSIGVTGVGQSSWGPTIFALVRNQTPNALVADLATIPEFANCTLSITAPDNRGAVFE